MRLNGKSIYVILMLVIAVWGLNMVMLKYLVHYVDPLLLSAIRLPLAGLFFLPFIWKKYGWYKPTGKQWVYLTLIGLMMICLHQITLSYGVSVTSATNASLILGLNPLATTLLAAVFVGEKLTFRLGFGALLGFSGVFLVVFGTSLGAPLQVTGWGDAIMLISMLTNVIGALFVKKVTSSAIPTMVITAYSTLLGGLMLMVSAWIWLEPGAYRQSHFSVPVLAVMLFSAWGSTSLGALGWNYGIKLLGAGKTAVFINGLPFAGMAAAILLLHEKVGAIHLAAFVLTTAGIVIASRKAPHSRLSERKAA